MNHVEFLYAVGASRALESVRKALLKRAEQIEPTDGKAAAAALRDVARLIHDGEFLFPETK
jgi:hypothetical protein